jgi:hypothetical protein
MPVTRTSAICYKRGMKATRWRLALITCALLTLGGSGWNPGYSSDKVARVVSPDGRLDAVLIETNGGATTSFGYQVDIRPHGSRETHEVARLYGAVRSDQAYGVNLRWTEASNLELDFLKSKLTPEIRSPVRFGGREVTVTVRSGVEDPSAPSGGMLYNLKKR